MGGRLNRRTQVVAGFVLFIVLAVGLSYHQYFDEGVAFEKTPIGEAAQHAGTWITSFLALFAFVVISLGVFVWLKRDSAVLRSYKIAREGRPEEALAMLREKMSQRPTALRAAAMGWILNNADRFAEASEAFALAESLQPTRVILSVERAVAMSKIGEGEGALAHLQKLEAGKPTEAGYVLAAAAVLDQLERPAEARQQFRRAENLFEQFPKPYHAQHSISSLRSRMAQRVGRDGGEGLQAELRRAIGQRASSAATIRDDAANDA